MKQFALSVILAASALAANAVNPADFPVLVPGQVYDVTYMTPFYGQYTAQSDGHFIEYGDMTVWTLGADSELELYEMNYAGYINGRQAYQCPVTAGTTYYFYDSFPMDSYQFSFELNPTLAVKSTSPEVGTMYDPAAEAYIDIFFNQALTVGKASVTIGELNAEVGVLSGSATVSVDLNDQLQQWYEQDKIEKGKDLLIKLMEITNIFGESVDDMTFTFLTAGQPGVLTDSQLPALFKSWWTDGDDSKAVLTFSHNLEANPTVELCYAPVELGYEYYETITPVIDGNTMTIDFSGKRRASEDMAPGRHDSNIFLRILTLKDSEGQMMWSPGQGTIGTYLFNIPFLNIPRLDIVSEFTPSHGATLEGASSVKIYFNKVSHLTYTGVAFTSGNDKVVVPISECTVAPEGEDGVEITAPIPAGWNEKENVTVTLDGLTADDGYDHTSDISARFNGFVVTFCNVAAGSSVKAFDEGFLLKAETNLAAGAGLSLTITDSEGTAIYGPAAMTEQSEAGVYLLTFDKKVTLTQGTAYTLTFTTAKGEDNITIIGATAPFAYADELFVSIDPASGSEISADQVIDLLFDGMVRLVPTADSATFTATAIDSEVEGYGYHWNLQLNADAQGEVTIAFTALSMAGQLVEGNAGEDAASHFEFTYKVTPAGIELIQATPATNGIYDLQGRPVANPTRGLYIINGKKVLK